MYRLKSWVSGLVLAAACFCAVPAHAAITSLSDIFNTENGGVGTLNYNAFTHWNVTNGTVDLVGNSFFDFYPGHGLYVDLDGSTGNAGILATKEQFAAGTYHLSFALGGSTRGDTNTVVVNFGAFSETFIYPSNAPLDTITRVVTLNAPASLSFANSGGDDLGLLLDNVNVALAKDGVPIIPEPGTCGLLALGIAPLLRRLRRQGATV